MKTILKNDKNLKNNKNEIKKLCGSGPAAYTHTQASLTV